MKGLNFPIRVIGKKLSRGSDVEPVMLAAGAIAQLAFKTETWQSHWQQLARRSKK